MISDKPLSLLYFQMVEIIKNPSFKTAAFSETSCAWEGSCCLGQRLKCFCVYWMISLNIWLNEFKNAGDINMNIFSFQAGGLISRVNNEGIFNLSHLYIDDPDYEGGPRHKSDYLTLLITCNLCRLHQVTQIHRDLCCPAISTYKVSLSLYFRHYSEYHILSQHIHNFLFRRSHAKWMWACNKQSCYPHCDECEMDREILSSHPRSPCLQFNQVERASTEILHNVIFGITFNSFNRQIDMTFIS